MDGLRDFGGYITSPIDSITDHVEDPTQGIPANRYSDWSSLDRSLFTPPKSVSTFHRYTSYGRLPKQVLDLSGNPLHDHGLGYGRHDPAIL